MADHHRHDHHNHGGYHNHEGHGHGHNGEKASANISAYWNTMAGSYDEKYQRTIEQLIREIQKRKDFIGAQWADDDADAGDDGKVKEKREVRLLDYACGTGLVSRALAQYTTQCVGVDISENMVDVYNARAENQGLAKHEMHAYQGNLLAETTPSSLSDPTFFNFDIAAVGLGFHHFADPETAAVRLVERLRPGGVLFLVEFMQHGPIVASDDPAAPTVMHDGFTEGRMREIFERAGAGRGFAVDEMGSGVVFHNSGSQNKTMKRRVFLARGEKA